jgi:hypothetical protein
MPYKICTYTLDSNIRLPELAWIDKGESEYAFRLLATHADERAPAHWFHQMRSTEGDVWLSLGRQGSDYLLRFPELADFLVSADGREICCRPVASTPLRTIKHLLYDQVFPLLLSKRGRLVAHASTIAMPDGAIAFVGMTGRGKSTLATSFSMHGFPFITDDCLLIEEENGQLFASPSYPV